MLLGVRQLATVGAVREVEFKLLHFICNSSDSAVPRVRSAFRYQPGPRTKSSLLQILPHAAHARRVTLSQRLAGGDGPQSCFVVNESTPSRVKRLPVRCNYHHHVGGNAGPRLCMFRTQCRTAEHGGTARLEAADDQDCRCRGDHPSQKTSSASRHILFQPAVQTLAESQRHFEHPFVSIQPNHVARTIEHGGAVLAPAEMLFHGSAQTRVDFTFKIVRNLAPHLFALDYHGLFPFAKDNLLLQAPPNPGASRSRSMSRARSRRVLTEAVEIPSALAVSSMLKCCMSRSTKTSRYICPSETSASASICRTSFRSRVSEGISRQSAKSRGV